jgi:subtilisin-like proprotein convertase family protein
MKKQMTVLVLAATVAVATADSFVFTDSNALTVPDGNAVGTYEQISVSGLIGAVTNIQVSLDISGGFNGDLYAYLAGPQGQLAVLLNRPGLTGINPYGYTDAGFNITLDGAVDPSVAANNIHNYASGGPGSYGLLGGQVTGTYAADGRLVDPQAAGSVIFGTSTANNLSVFNNLSSLAADGTWTLFIADLVPGGGTPTLNNVVLTVMTAPEPQTWGMLAGGLALLTLFRRNCWQR